MFIFLSVTVELILGKPSTRAASECYSRARLCVCGTMVELPGSLVVLSETGKTWGQLPMLLTVGIEAGRQTLTHTSIGFTLGSRRVAHLQRSVACIIPIEGAPSLRFFARVGGGAAGHHAGRMGPRPRVKSDPAGNLHRFRKS